MRYLLFTCCIALTVLSSAQELYDPGVVTTIDITFTQSNWDNILDGYYSAGNEERLVGTVVINGQVFEGAGVKYKGNSTYNANNTKNPMNIKLDYTIDQNYQGYNTLKLANGRMDPTWVREPLSYEIIRKYMQAPKSNFAWVTVNGSSYGLMCSSESVNSAFIDSHFYSDNDNVFFKCNPQSVMGIGNPVAGCDDSNNCSLEYLGSDSACYNIYYEIESDFGWNALRDLTQQIETNFSNHDAFLDRDKFIWMAAANNVLVNLDSYTGPFVQNYYLYKDDQQIYNPVMWDFNQSFGSFSMIGSGGPGQGTTTAQLQQMDPFLREGDAAWPMLNNIFADPTLRRMYVAHCKTMLEENFLNDLYLERAQAYQTSIDALMQTDPNDFYTHANFVSNLNASVSTGSGPGGGNIVGITQLMEARKEYLMSVEEFTYIAPAITNIQAPVSVLAQSSATITAEISGSTWVMIGHRSNQSIHFVHDEMFDDGLHNDGSAGDGIFGFEFLNVPMGGIEYFIYAENSNAGIFSPARAEKEFYRIGTLGSLVINELQSSNTSTILDGSGDYEDWIELFNSSSTAIQLSDYFLSDEIDNPLKFQLPSALLNPGEYAILWCDEEQTEGSDHANFKLPSEGGETITLSNAQSTIMDLVFLPSVASDATYGRYPNGNGPVMNLEPTCAATNSNVLLIEEISDLHLLVYPNPTSSELNVLLVESGVQEVNIKDLTGKVIFTQKTNGMKRLRIETAALSSGVYIVQAGSATASFMKL